MYRQSKMDQGYCCTKASYKGHYSQTVSRQLGSRQVQLFYFMILGIFVLNLYYTLVATKFCFLFLMKKSLLLLAFDSQDGDVLNFMYVGTKESWTLGGGHASGNPQIYQWYVMDFVLITELYSCIISKHRSHPVMKHRLNFNQTS